MNKKIIKGLYWETWYNRGYKNGEVKCPDGVVAKKPCQVPPADRNMMYENRVLGLPRIRSGINVTPITTISRRN